MKRTLFIFAVFMSLFISSSSTLLFSSQVSAANVFPNGCNQGSKVNPAVCNDVKAQVANNGTNDPIVNIIKAAIDVLSGIIGAAAVIGLLASSFRIVISNGDSNAIASTRTSLLYCLIGIVIAALAQMLVIFVLDKV